MGVHRNYRKLGLGQLLIEYLINWIKTNSSIEYLDLCVLSNNKPAIRLYKRLGFQTIGETKDMFRIDGVTYNYTMMTKQVSSNYGEGC